jgi:hypothetical protein
LIIGLERDGAGKGKVSPTIQTGSGELIITREAVHHDPRGPALGIEYIKNVVVGIAIMDDKGLAEAVGEGDVRRKGVPLYGLTGSVRCPEIVQPGLPDCLDARMLGQRLHQLKARQQLRPHSGGIVRVDRDTGDH